METQEKSLTITPDKWLENKQRILLNAIDSLKQVKSFSVPDPTEDLRKIHTSLNGCREYQTWVLNLLVGINAMDLEVRRLLAKEESSLKDSMGRAFVEHADVVALGKSFEEKSLRLRPYVPEIKNVEEWTSILKMVESVKDTLNMVYQDLSKSGFALNTQVNLLKVQIMTGDIKLAVGDSGMVKALFSEATLSSVEKATSGEVLTLS